MVGRKLITFGLQPFAFVIIQLSRCRCVNFSASTSTLAEIRFLIIVCYSTIFINNRSCKTRLNGRTLLSEMDSVMKSSFDEVLMSTAPIAFVAQPTSESKHFAISYCNSCLFAWVLRELLPENLQQKQL